MRSAKQLLVMLICVLLCLPAVQAQDAQQQSAKASSDVTIIIQQDKVRFTTQKAGEEMRLQVFDQSGELVFDSGAVEATEVTWPLQSTSGSGSGEMLKSGLYAYTLSIKEVGKEAGVAEARLRRGHFIVDRAKDRDGADKLWVTSQNESGVGAELTVAKDEAATIAGANITGERTVGNDRSGLSRDSKGRELERETPGKLDASKSASATAITAGTVGQIAKFTSTTEVGNSTITELNGKVGLGTTAPLSKLHVLSGANDLLPPRLESSGTTGFAAGWDFYHGATGKGYVGVPNSAAEIAPGEMVVLGGAGTKTSLFAGGNRSVTLNTNGNVGIGTTSFSPSRMTIEGQDALTVRGYEPFLNLKDSNDFLFQSSHRIQSAHGDLGFFYGYQPRSSPTTVYAYTYVPRMVIKDSGNVGIGTIAPNHQLSLGRGPTWTRNGWGGSLELENASAIGWKSNLAGNRFGIGQTNTGLYFFRTTSDPGTTGSPAIYDMWINDSGMVNLRTLTIVGGADFAENFDINAAPTATAGSEAAKVEAGMVVSIDPAHPGKLKLSAQAYDRRVAGIISGAGGVQPGMTMGQEKTLANGNHPVALSGRVYVWADATHGAIRVGDLLTTSTTPGHAMKAGNWTRAQGATIGKAMTTLKSGKGLVLVLITLQ